jgi:cytochrome P450
VGIPEKAWVEEYGPVVRTVTVGPLGQERVMFTKADALQKILASDLTYPKVHVCPGLCYFVLMNAKHQPGLLCDALRLILGCDLVTIAGNEHKEMRKTLSLLFPCPISLPVSVLPDINIAFLSFIIPTAS